MAFVMLSFFCDLCLCVLAIGIVGYLWFRHRYTYWSKKGVYSPPPTFPTGNVSDMMLRSLQIGQQFENIYYENRKHPFIGIYLAHKVALVVNDPELIKTVMVKEFMHFTDHGMVHNEESEPLEGHLFNINGNRWRNLRVKLIPAFTSGKMKVMFDTLVHYGHIMQEYIEPNVLAGNAVDMKETLARYSTDIIGTCVFGIETNSLKSKEPRFRNMSKKSQTLPFFRSMIQTMSLMAPWIVSRLKVSMYQNDVNEFFVGAANEAVKYRTSENVKGNDYLQILMKLWEERQEVLKKEGKILNEEEDGTMTMGDLAAQFFVFFVDGVETSSTTASFALFELARNPDIQKRLRDEIDEVLARHGGQFTFEALCDMKYLFQVVEEALRMYPPLPLILRVCTRDFKIPGTEVIIDKGTSVMIPILGIHRDPDIFPNPMKFNPDRFTPENKAQRHKFTHLPFGEGPRMCMGNRFGMLMSRMGLIFILSKYEVSLAGYHKEPFDYKPNSFILAPLNGINIKLTRRLDLSKQIN